MDLDKRHFHHLVCLDRSVATRLMWLYTLSHENHNNMSNRVSQELKGAVGEQPLAEKCSRKMSCENSSSRNEALAQFCPSFPVKSEYDGH